MQQAEVIDAIQRDGPVSRERCSGRHPRHLAERF
jgi:hypothetical protein